MEFTSPSSSSGQGLNAPPILLRALPSTSYAEATAIRASFSRASCRAVQDLPSVIKPGAVHEKRIQQLSSHRFHPPSTVFTKSYSCANQPFSPFKYETACYEKISNISKLDLEDERHMLASYAKKPFVVTHNNSLYNTSAAIPNTLNRYEDDATLKAGVITRESSTHLFGAFQSTVHRHKRAYKEPSIDDIQLWLSLINKTLVADWSHLRFKLQFTQGKEILILFEKNDRLPLANALVNYMNQMSIHGVAAQIGLTRRGDRWYTLEDHAEKRGSPAAAERSMSEAVDDEADERALTTFVVFSFYAPGVNPGPLRVFKSVSASHRSKAKNKMPSSV